MYAKTYAKMDILISDELNQCMALGKENEDE
jgi:hypothetical protein